MMNQAVADHGLTGPDGFAEDLPAGRRMRHPRAATVGEFESQMLSKLVMNTAQIHYNERFADGGRLVFGLVTASIVLGLAGQDTVAQAIEEVELDDMRFLAPVRPGTTLTAFTEVAEVAPDQERDDVRRITFIHFGVDQDERLVFQCRRTARIRCRPTAPPRP